MRAAGFSEQWTTAIRSLHMTGSLLLEGRRVLITGGAGGVGSAVAERMAAQGARLLITDRDQTELDRLVKRLRASPERQIEALAAEIATSNGMEEVFGHADQRLGGLDMLVACAGVGSGPLMEMDDAGWRDVIDSNLVSYLACTQAAIKRFRTAGIRDGLIILVGSISVHIKAVGESVYNASKGGVALFAETLRKEMMAEHIRVTLIEPGAIGSAMQPFSEAERATMMEDYRLLPPAEVAEAIMFAATRPPGVDVVTLRIEPLIQKIY
jgi:3-hydroxy acid dehydrogenase / malonic semialdehyde reductase